MSQALPPIHSSTHVCIHKCVCTHSLPLPTPPQAHLPPSSIFCHRHTQRLTHAHSQSGACMRTCAHTHTQTHRFALGFVVSISSVLLFLLASFILAHPPLCSPEIALKAVFTVFSAGDSHDIGPKIVCMLLWFSLILLFYHLCMSEMR